MGRNGNSPLLENIENQNIDVGSRLRVIRTTQGLSIRALAERSGLNVNTLSLIENGKTSPSVSTLQVLAQSLAVSISSFFESVGGEQKITYQKHGKRPRAAFVHGNIQDLGAGMPRFGAEPLIVTLNPGADSGKTPIVHTGREFVYCLDGQAEYQVDGTTYPLAPGDSLLFEAYLPHRWRNTSGQESHLLLVLCPTDERDQPQERHFSS
jgi:transcriptional regulator with XRE-family HTH domain